MKFQSIRSAGIDDANQSKSKRKNSIICLFLAMIFFLSGCGIYDGGFQRGGELTSSLIDRIQENPKDEEDTLLPIQNETEQCLKPYRRSARK